MNDVAVFLIGIGLTLVLSFMVVRYLKPHLHRILVDLCGTKERADFWTVFSIVMLMLIPFIAAMSYRPRSGQDASVLFELSNQIRWGLIGLAGSVIILGLTLSRFVPRIQPSSANQPTQADMRQSQAVDPPA